MTRKLALTVEKTIVKKAKAYARNMGISLSELIENYLESIVEEKPSPALSPKLRKIVGIIKLPKNYDIEKERRVHLENKHF